MATKVGMLELPPTRAAEASNPACAVPWAPLKTNLHPATTPRHLKQASCSRNRRTCATHSLCRICSKLPKRGRAAPALSSAMRCCLRVKDAARFGGACTRTCACTCTHEPLTSASAHIWYAGDSHPAVAVLSHHSPVLFQRTVVPKLVLQLLQPLSRLLLVDALRRLRVHLLGRLVGIRLPHRLLQHRSGVMRADAFAPDSDQTAARLAAPSCAGRKQLLHHARAENHKLQVPAGAPTLAGRLPSLAWMSSHLVLSPSGPLYTVWYSVMPAAACCCCCCHCCHCCCSCCRLLPPLLPLPLPLRASPPLLLPSVLPAADPDTQYVSITNA